MTMEIDALHAGQPMRNGLDPCDTCSDWLALKAENDRLRAALKVARAYIARYGYTGEQLRIIDAALQEPKP